MKATAHPTPTRRELDHRHANGVDVTLSWSPSDDRLFVTVLDDSGDAFELAVAAHEALEVFSHPYAYATRCGARIVDVGLEVDAPTCA